MTDRHSAPSIEDAVAYQLHRTNRLLLTHLGRFLSDTSPELSPEAFFIVMKLAENDTMHQSELVEVALDDGPNVSRHVDRLVGAGLVERTENPADRRARLLTLSKAGRLLATKLTSDVQSERQVVFAGINDATLVMLTDTLDQLNSNLRASLTKGERTAD